MTYERILKPNNNYPIVAHVVKRHESSYNFCITRNMPLDYIKTQLRLDTWETALRYHFNIPSLNYVAMTQKELIQMVYERVLEITGSSETAMNTPIFLFDQDKGRWQLTVPKWPTRFYDRTYLSGLTNLYYGHFYTIDYKWDTCFISRLARAKDLRKLIRYTQLREDCKDVQFDDREEQLRYICESILADLPHNKDGFVGLDYTFHWNYDDKCWM